MDFAFFQTAFFVQYKSFVVYVVRAALSKHPQEIMFSLNIRDKLIYEYAEKTVSYQLWNANSLCQNG